MPVVLNGKRQQMNMPVLLPHKVLQHLICEVGLRLDPVLLNKF